MFEYLMQYKAENLQEKRINISTSNCFGKVLHSEIIEAEKILCFSLPKQLRIFYQEIGCGNLTAPQNRSSDYVFFGANEILDPITVANFATGKLLWDSQKNYISEDVYEDLQPGDIPFFEISDSSSFMIMKALSDNPNAIWYMGKEKIEESLDEFIHNLYYKNPSYYADNW
ncbi:MAG: hypothetical protein LBS23_01830 [Holosporaceae bacterium]|nr:hypothetical protein [Holosporaceae bacterium]